MGDVLAMIEDEVNNKLDSLENTDVPITYYGPPSEGEGAQGEFVNTEADLK